MSTDDYGYRADRSAEDSDLKDYANFHGDRSSSQGRKEASDPWKPAGSHGQAHRGAFWRNWPLFTYVAK